MIAILALASLLTLGPTPDGSSICFETALGGGDDSLRELYREGRSYTDFLARATRRTELWHENTTKAASIDMDLVSRARAVGGTWRFLAVAVDSCSDSVSTIPYLAQLVALVPGLDMRVVDSTVGRSIMEGHPTSDGRASTPTILLLDHDFEEVGCFIERPPRLKTWFLANDGTLSADELYEQKMEWYAGDAGQNTIEAFIVMLEAAAGGSTVCS